MKTGAFECKVESVGGRKQSSYRLASLDAGGNENRRLTNPRAYATVARMSVLIRAEIDKRQWKNLRQLAIELEVPVQQLVGGLIEEYLRANGIEEKDA